MLLCIGVEKGGAGKSTVCQNLASVRASLGHSVVILDLDGQATSAKWVSRRNEDETLPAVAIERLAPKKGEGNTAALKRQLPALAEQYTDVFIDVGGKDTDLLRLALAACDRTIVPLVPSPADLDTVPDFADVVEAIHTARGERRPVQVILNMTSGSPRMLNEMLEGMGPFHEALPVMKKRIGTRVAFKRAMSEGKGVHELTGRDFDPAAANEIKDLYLEVFGK
ncbi:division plane positioning ATPase MipZ [Paraburkholderia sediminicola]|uniref:division plane positioning ATPase MipZ n=1 Tax=Paraburkholderia sediminicola TaxID=458836 RepID=UPI0038B74EEA